MLEEYFVQVQDFGGEVVLQVSLEDIHVVLEHLGKASGLLRLFTKFDFAAIEFISDQFFNLVAQVSLSHWLRAIHMNSEEYLIAKLLLNLFLKLGYVPGVAEIS